MPMLETVDELVEALADMCGIYNQGLQFEGMSVAETRAFNEERSSYDGNHADTWQCRMCWCGAMERRIRAAAANEARLAR